MIGFVALALYVVGWGTTALESGASTLASSAREDSGVAADMRLEVRP